MADFNTHGGYFAPAGYMKVNEGGTHEENPNGGVQIGVDPEGVPNMVEEGEPIYNDFVFSDNIKAQEKFLVEANVPKRYAGKLYSEIVDDLFAEAEERPNDPISKNGLESMLGRVAQAQEAQKAAEEEQALMEELQNMSPEELEALEQMLAQPQEEQMPVPEEAVPMEAAEMVPEEQAVPEMPAPQMMASGGNIYRGGNRLQKMFDSVTERLRNAGTSNGIQVDPVTGAKYELPLEVIHPELDVALTYAQPGSIATKLFAPSAYKGMVSGLAKGEGSQALIYGLVPESGEWVEISRRAADMQAGNSSKYALYKAVGKGEHLPSPIASRKANLVERGVTSEGEPYVVRVNEFADPNELARRAAYWRSNEKYSGPAEWANSGSGSWKVHGKASGGPLKEAVSHFFNGPETWTAPDGNEYPILKGEPPVVGKAAGVVKGAVNGVREGAKAFKTSRGLKKVGRLINNYKEPSFVPFWKKALPWAIPTGVVAGGLISSQYGEPEVEGAYMDYEFDPNDFARGGNLFYPGGHVTSVMDLLRGGVSNPATVEAKLNTIDLIRQQGRQNPVVLSRTTPVQTAVQQYWPSAFYTDGATNNSGYARVNEIGAGNPTSLRDIYTGGYFRPTAPNNVGYVFYPTLRGRSTNIYVNPNTGQQVSAGTIHTPAAQNTETAQEQPFESREDFVGPVRTTTTGTTTGANASSGTGSQSTRRPTSTLPAGPAVPVPTVDPLLSDDVLDYMSKAGVDPREYEAGFGRIPIEPAVINGRATTNNGGLRGGYNEWLGTRLTKIDNLEPVVDDGRKGRPTLLSTLPRYAGAIGSGLLALNNLLQKPDHYEDVPIRPVLPNGRILLQDERYMPLDQNMVTNQIQANNAANARAILNAGAGPSTGALLAAADYTGGLNLGNAMNQVWQANNQERNRVIAANNQNAATRAQFYRDLDSQRAQIMNNMAMLNRQNALRVAMLNNQAEQDKYNAFGQNLGNSLQALSGIGQENFAMNQLNTNSAFGWYVGPDGRAYYRGPNWNKCGGLLKKAK